ncbi:MAG: cell division protein SepF [Ruminococcaceae bacterium]|nr:cell division protein SepF [Oscillospiraceae bacterium]
MNLLKKFVRNDNADLEEDYEEMYVMPDDIRMEMPDTDAEEGVSSIDSPSRKEPEIQPVSADKVSLKLLQPKSHIEATKIADKLKEGCIVLLDISHLSKDQAHRLVDFLAGVAYVLGGEMIKTNKSTIVVSPAGVDISGFAPDLEDAAPAVEAVEEETEDAVAEEEPAEA